MFLVASSVPNLVLRGILLFQTTIISSHSSLLEMGMDIGRMASCPISCTASCKRSGGVDRFLSGRNRKTI